MSLEQLEAAIRELTELYLHLELPKVWGAKTVAADGDPVRPLRNNLAVGYHFGYGRWGWLPIDTWRITISGCFAISSRPTLGGGLCH
jgi:hypothetical protein